MACCWARRFRAMSRRTQAGVVWEIPAACCRFFSPRHCSVSAWIRRVILHNANRFWLGLCHARNGMRIAYSHNTTASNGSFLLRCIMALAKSRTARGFAIITSTPSVVLNSNATSTPYIPVASKTTLTRRPPRVRISSNLRCPAAVFAYRCTRWPSNATTNSRALTSSPHPAILSIAAPRSRLCSGSPTLRCFQLTLYAGSTACDSLQFSETRAGGRSTGRLDVVLLGLGATRPPPPEPLAALLQSSLSPNRNIQGAPQFSPAREGWVPSVIPSTGGATHSCLAGCPSIRAKALSRDTSLQQCFAAPRGSQRVEGEDSGNLTVNHFPVKAIVSPTIDTAQMSAMILLCESRLSPGRERPIKVTV